MAQPIFISHATADDDFVKRLRVALESRGLTVWADSRELAGGAMLDAEIERALRHARCLIVVVSLAALNSAWVQREVKLAQEGVTSVVAMTHSVLVSSARRFMTAFYAELATGARVGRAMLAGQRALYNDPRRGVIMGAGELRLHDWFVPVLYQEAHDPQLFTRLPNAAAQRMAADRRQAHLGALPRPPATTFMGAAASCWRWNGCWPLKRGASSAARGAWARRPWPWSWRAGWRPPIG